jgi:hypothetical protein
MSNHRFSKFYWQDWHGEPTLEMCSLAARGLWMELLCLAHTGAPYGHVTLGGEPATTKQISKYARTSEKEVAALIAELERFKVFDRTDSGVIFSRRMVSDGHKSEEGAEAAKKRWKNKPNPNGSGNGKDTGKAVARPYGPPKQIPNTLEAEAEAEAERGRARAIEGAHAPAGRGEEPEADDGNVVALQRGGPVDPIRSPEQQLAILRGEKLA